MKKSFILLLGCLLGFVSVSRAQLAFDHEFGESDFNNGSTVLHKTDNVSWSNGVLGIAKGMSLGKFILLGEAVTDEVVIALPSVGLADSIVFEYQGGSSSCSITLSESANNSSWSGIWTTTEPSTLTAVAVSRKLSSTTRYLKFSYTGKASVRLNAIKVSELKKLSLSSNQYQFGAAMVDDAPVSQTFQVYWTNIVTSVTCSDAHFVVSKTTIGEKNLMDQTTALTVTYNHTEAGSHQATIRIAGEGRSVSIAVSGETKKYDQTLYWNQELPACTTTSTVMLNAFADSNLPISYASSDSTIAVADETGKVVIYCAGDVSFTAYQAGNYKYNPSESVTKTLTISKVDPTIAVTCENIVYGSALSSAHLSETLNKVAGMLTWEGVSQDSILHAGIYTLQVRFVPEDACLYNQKVLPVQLVVEKAPQTISWEQEVTSLTVGEYVVLDAQASSHLPLTYAFTECIVGIEGDMLHAEQAGNVTIIAYHPGNEDYLPTTIEMTDFTIYNGTSTQVSAIQSAPTAVRKRMSNGSVLIEAETNEYDITGNKLK